MAALHLWDDASAFGNVPDGDLLALWGNGKSSELWEGRLVQAEMTSPYHGVVANEIGFLLRGYVQQHALNTYVMQHTLFNLTRSGQSRTILAPAVALFPLGLPLVHRAIPPFAPWLAVEVLSPTQTLSDMCIKCQTYLQAGTAEAWIVDPEQVVVEVITTHGATTYTAQQTLVSTILPGFTPLVQSLVP